MCLAGFGRAHRTRLADAGGPGIARHRQASPGITRQSGQGVCGRRRNGSEAAEGPGWVLFAAIVYWGDECGLGLGCHGAAVKRRPAGSGSGSRGRRQGRRGEGEARGLLLLPRHGAGAFAGASAGASAVCLEPSAAQHIVREPCIRPYCIVSYCPVPSCTRLRGVVVLARRRSTSTALVSCSGWLAWALRIRHQLQHSIPLSPFPLHIAATPSPSPPPSLPATLPPLPAPFLQPLRLLLLQLILPDTIPRPPPWASHGLPAPSSTHCLCSPFWSPRRLPPCPSSRGCCGRRARRVVSCRAVVLRALHSRVLGLICSQPAAPRTGPEWPEDLSSPPTHHSSRLPDFVFLDPRHLCMSVAPCSVNAVLRRTLSATSTSLSPQHVRHEP